jgi:hypothetical protein
MPHEWGERDDEVAAGAICPMPECGALVVAFRATSVISQDHIESPAAKEELHKHLSAVRMFPSEDGEGWYYIAEGTWDLLGTDPLAPDMRVREEGRIRMVAGGGFEPPTFGLCDLTHLSMRVGLYLHPGGVLAIQSLRLPPVSGAWFGIPFIARAL